VMLYDEQEARAVMHVHFPIQRQCLHA
jgi:hypothetical protein